MLSIIVPVLNEERTLPAFLEMANSWPRSCELIFTDGGSTDATLQILAGHTVVEGARGRGAQCRLAATKAQGEFLVFMHADSIVQADAIEAIIATLEQGVPWGCLTLRFDTKSPLLAFGGHMSNVRVSLWGIPFGDQVMFMTREAYDAVGGMPDLPLMEDYELARRLRAIARPKRLRQHVVTSARRFESGGLVRTMAHMRHLRHLYRSGVTAEELAKLYGEGR